MRSARGRRCQRHRVSKHGAVCRSGNGDDPIDVSVPSAATLNAETLPWLAPPCALETNSWLGLVGRNSLPNGPTPCAAKGEPGAAASRPSRRTAKLSISEVPTRVPAGRVPPELNRTSPGSDPLVSEIVEPANARSRPPEFIVKTV